MKLGSLNACHYTVQGTCKGTLLLVHGMGLGKWMWERDQALYAEAGFESWAIDLPAHGDNAGEDCNLEQMVTAVAEAAGQLENPILIGHSLGGLIAQLVAERLKCRGMVLINAVPPGGVRWVPSWLGVKAFLPHLHSVLRSKFVTLSFEAYQSTGFKMIPEDQQRMYFDKVTPWPASVLRDLLPKRPKVASWPCPVLVTIGHQDLVVSTWTSRLIGDYHDAVIWRFDDLGHMPPIEPNGERMVRYIIDWLENPRARKIKEIDAFAPDQGVGQEMRDKRRGPMGRRRSNSRFKRG